MKERTQVGGNHYKMAIEPIEFIERNGLTFSEGCVVKYISRHRYKGGKQDLLKAIDYINRIIEFEYPEQLKEPQKTACKAYLDLETAGEILPFMCE